MTEIDPETDADWNRLATVWRATAPPAPAAAALAALVEREQRRLKVDTAVEIVATLLLAAMLGWLASLEQGGYRLLMAGLAAAALVSPLLTAAWRRRLWQATALSLAEHAPFLRRRARLGLWLGWCGVVATPLGVATGVVLGSQDDFASSAGTGIGLVVASAVLCLAGWLSLREVRRNRAMLRAIDTGANDNGSQG